MTQIKILHLSDLHYDLERHADSDIVIEALINDLRENDIRPHAVIFTGDLVKKGGDPAQFVAAQEAFLEPLSKELEVDKRCFFLCPGNHDVAWTDLASWQEEGLFKCMSSLEATNKFIDDALVDPASARPALQRLDNFMQFRDSWGTAQPITSNQFLSTYRVEVDGADVGIALFNTAWRATGNGDLEKNRLILGERAVDVAAADLAGADLAIAAYHHPLDWLREFDQLAVEARLYAKFDLLLCGHTHRTAPEIRQTATANAVLAQGGCLYEERKHFNGYQLITVDLAALEVEFWIRTYHDNPRRVFDAALNVCPGGQQRFVMQKKSSSNGAAVVERFLRHARMAIRQKASEHISALTGDEGSLSFNDYFARPPICRKRDAHSADPATDYACDDDILGSSANFIVFGRREAGKTSLAHHLSLRASELGCDEARIPVVIDARTFTMGNGMVRRAVREYYADLDKSAALDEALGYEKFLFIVDNVDPSSEKHERQLKSLLDKSVYSRFVFLVDDNIPLTRNMWSSQADEFEILYIHPLPRRTIRQLSRQWCNRSGLDPDRSFDTLMDHLTRANLPRTGYIVSLLLWAMEKKRNLDRVNEAFLLENIVDALLNKADFSASLRKDFDFRGTQILLQELAVHLKASGGFVPENDAIEFIVLFFKRKGLNFGAPQVLYKLITCGVLVSNGGLIGFRYRCFEEYFVAGKMLAHPGDFESVWDGTGFVRYAREIELAAGLDRQSPVYLDRLKSKLEALEPAFLREADTDGLTKVSINEATVDVSRSRIQEIRKTELSQAEVDDLVDYAETKSVERSRRRTSETEPKKALDEGQAINNGPGGFFAYIATIDAYGRVLKNLEYIDAENKKDHISVFLDCWMRFLSDVLSAIHDVLEDLLSEHAEGRFENMTQEMIEVAEYAAKVSLPTALSNTISDEIGNEKLVPVLREMMQAGTKKSHDVIIAFVLLDLRDPSWREAWEQCLKRYSTNKYVMRLMLEKLWLHYTSHYIRPHEKKAFEDIISDLEINVAGTQRHMKPYVIDGIRKKRISLQDDKLLT